MGLQFKFNCQEHLIAYRPPAAGEHRQGVGVELLIIDFCQAGSHKNFYAELKLYLKLEG